MNDVIVYVFLIVVTPAVNFRWNGFVEVEGTNEIIPGSISICELGTPTNRERGSERGSELVAIMWWTI